MPPIEMIDTDPPFDVDPPAGDAASPDADKETALALRQTTSTVATIDKIEAGIAALETEYAGHIFDVATPKGMAAAKEARIAIREPRYAAQAAAKNGRSFLESLKKSITRRENKIVERLKAIEDPIHEQVKAEEDRKAAEKEAAAKAESARVQGIVSMIAGIKDAVLQSINKPVEVIDGHMRALESLDVNLATFAEFTGEAQQAKAQALEALAGMREQRAAFEDQQAAEALRVEQERLAQAEREAADARERAEQAQRDKVLREQNEAAAARLATEREQFERERREHQARIDKEAADRKAVQDAEDAARRAEQEAEDKAAREAAAAAKKVEDDRIEAERAAEQERKDAEDRAAREEADRVAEAHQRVRDASNVMLAALQAVMADCADIDTDSCLSPAVGVQVRSAIATATGNAA